MAPQMGQDPDAQRGGPTCPELTAGLLSASQGQKGDEGPPGTHQSPVCSLEDGLCLSRKVLSWTSQGLCVCGGVPFPAPTPQRSGIFMQRQPGLRGMHDNELPELFKGPLG